MLLCYYVTMLRNVALYERIYLKIQGTESPLLSPLPRLTPKAPAQEVVSPINHKPDLICDMVHDSKGANVRSLAEAIDEEVSAVYSRYYLWFVQMKE